MASREDWQVKMRTEAPQLISSLLVLNAKLPTHLIWEVGRLEGWKTGNPSFVFVV